MTSPQEEQFTKPKKHMFRNVVVVLIIFVVGIYLIYAFSGDEEAKTEEDIISAIAEQFATSTTATGTDGGPGALTADLLVTQDDPFFGSRDAKVAIVEFGDFECPFCRQAHPSVKTLQEAFGDQIFFQFRDFPIIAIHDQALNASLAAECAHDQSNEAFWTYHDRLYQFQEELTDDVYIGLAQRMGLNVPDFTTCFEESKHLSEIQEDYDAGIAAGVTGTPTFFINGHRVPGVIPEEIFIGVIEELLKIQSN